MVERPTPLHAEEPLATPELLARIEREIPLTGPEVERIAAPLRVALLGAPMPEIKLAPVKAKEESDG